MRESVRMYIEKLKTDKVRRRRILGIFCVLAMFVAGGVFWNLRIIGITKTAEPMCGIEEHKHTQDCIIDRILICGFDDEDTSYSETVETIKVFACPFNVHTHEAVCYDEFGNVICGYADFSIHGHDINCFDEQGILACSLAEVYEHIHDENCFTQETIWNCGYGDASESTLHLHDENCFTETQNLICEIVDDEEHIHDENCFEAVKVLTCTEPTEHIHDENCIPGTFTTLTCSIPEVVAHTHSDDCYDEFGMLICGMLQVEVHQHDEFCYMLQYNDLFIADDSDIANLGNEPLAHVHTDECYEIVYSCGGKEHTHNINCFADINCDVETLSDWKAMADEVYAQFTEGGDDGEEIPAFYYFYYLAMSQAGYQESEFNFSFIDGVRKGYNRYSDWFTGGLNPYTDWNASFVQFCLHFAGIDNLPKSNGVYSWQVMLEKEDLFIPISETALRGASDNFPSIGDIIFVDTNNDGISDRVGIIVEYDDIEDNFIVLEGDCSVNGNDADNSGLLALSNNMEVGYYSDDTFVDLSDIEIYDPFGDVTIPDDASANGYEYQYIDRDCVDFRQYSIFDEGIIGFVKIAELPEVAPMAAYDSPRPYNELAYEENYQGGDVVKGDYSDLSTVGNFALVNLGIDKGSVPHNYVLATDKEVSSNTSWEFELSENGKHAAGSSDISIFNNTSGGTGLTAGGGATTTTTDITLTGNHTIGRGGSVTENADGSLYAAKDQNINYFTIALPKNLNFGESITLEINSLRRSDYRVYLSNGPKSDTSYSNIEYITGDSQTVTFVVSVDAVDTASNLVIKGVTYDSDLDDVTIRSIKIITDNTGNATYTPSWASISLTDVQGAFDLAGRSITVEQFKQIISKGEGTLTVNYSCNPSSDNFNFAVELPYGVCIPDNENISKTWCSIPMHVYQNGDSYTATISVSKIIDFVRDRGCTVDQINNILIQPSTDSSLKILSVSINGVPVLAGSAENGYPEGLNYINQQSGTSDSAPMQVFIKQQVGNKTYYLYDDNGTLSISETQKTAFSVFSDGKGNIMIGTHWGVEAQQWRSKFICFENKEFTFDWAYKPSLAGSGVDSYDFTNVADKFKFAMVYSGGATQVMTYPQVTSASKGDVIGTFDIMNDYDAYSLYILDENAQSTSGPGTTTIGPTLAMVRKDGIDKTISEDQFVGSASYANWYIEGLGDGLYNIYSKDANGNKKYISLNSSAPADYDGERFSLSYSGEGYARLHALGSYSDDPLLIAPAWWNNVLSYVDNDNKWTTVDRWADNGTHYDECGKFYFYDINGNRITTVLEGQTIQCSFVINNNGIFSPIRLNDSGDNLALVTDIGDESFGKSLDYATWYINRVSDSFFKIYTYDPNGKRINLSIKHNDGKNVIVGISSSTDFTELRALGTEPNCPPTKVASNYYGACLTYDVDGSWIAGGAANSSDFYFYDLKGDRITNDTISIGQTIQCSFIQKEGNAYYPVVLGHSVDNNTAIGATPINVSDTAAIEAAMVWDALAFTDNNISNQNRIRLPLSDLYIPIANRFNANNGLTYTDVFTGEYGSKFDFIPVTFNDGKGKNDYVLIRSLGGSNENGDTNGSTNYYLAVNENYQLIYKEYHSLEDAKNDTTTHFRVYINDPRDTYNEDDPIFIPNNNKTTVKYDCNTENSTVKVRINLEIGEEFNIDVLNSIFKPGDYSNSVYCNSVNAVEEKCAQGCRVGTTYYYNGDSSIANVVFERGNEVAGEIDCQGQKVTANVCDTIHIIGVADGITQLEYRVCTDVTWDNKGEASYKYKTLIVYVGVGTEKVYAGKDHRYYHLDVEVDADFDILVYGSGGTVDVIAPTNVQVQSVYAKVYNTAALIDGNGKAEWDKDYYAGNPTTHHLKPGGGDGGYVNPWKYPWLLYKSSADNKYYPVVDGSHYVYDQYVYINPDNNTEDGGAALKAFLNAPHDKPVKLSDIEKYLIHTGEYEYGKKVFKTREVNPDEYYYNHLFSDGHNPNFRFGTDPVTGNVIHNADDPLNTNGYYEHDSYNGQDVQSVYVGYNQRGSSANGQFEFLTYGWGWMEFYDGDTVELYVTVSYDYNGRTYYTQRKVVTTICDANNVCPSTYDNWLIHGFDVEVIFEDIVEVQSTGIYKCDQYGNPVPNATFQLFKSDKNGNIIGKNGQVGDDSEPIYEVTSDASGYFHFTNSEGKTLTMAEFYESFGFGENEDPYFVIREKSVPQGYRMIPDLALFHFVLGGVSDSDGDGELDPTGSYTFVICDNSYKTGVRANPNALVQAPYILTDMESGNQNPITFATVIPQHVLIDDNGTPDDKSDDVYLDYDELNITGNLYAVVIKRRGLENPLDFNHYTPVYGNDYNGYQFWDMTGLETSSDAVKAMIADAKKNNIELSDYGIFKFRVSESGASIITSITEIPGDISQYYNYQRATKLERNEQGDLVTKIDENTLEYIIAYFYEDTNGNITRVKSDYDYESGLYKDNKFDIHWTTTIEVPNIENRLFFTKKDVNGNLLDKAYFALYGVEEFRVGNDYLVGYRASNNNYYYLYDYDPNANSGKAQLINYDTDGSGNIVGTGHLDSAVYTYTIDTTTTAGKAGYETYTYSGQIRISTGTGTVYINPAENRDTSGGPAKHYVGYTHDSCEVVGTDGTGHFGRIPEGKYVLREIVSPAGYSVNAAETLVLVDALGVYANAGSAGNDVRVGNGVGYLVSTMTAYATEASVNESLAWIYMHAVKNGATTFNGFGNVKTWDYNHDDVWGVKGVNAGKSTGVSYLVYDGVDSLNPDDTGIMIPDYEDNGLSLFDYRASRDQRISGDEVYYFDPIKKVYITITGEDAKFNRTVPGIKGDSTALNNLDITEGSTLVMYNTQGWSTVRIFQDYYYGSVASKNSHAMYDALTVNGAAPNTESDLLNITDLFSSSTFVEVTDRASADLILVKTFDNIETHDHEAERKEAAFTMKKLGTTYNLTTGLSKREDGNALCVQLPEDLHIPDDTDIIVSLTGTSPGTQNNFRFYFNPQVYDHDNNVCAPQYADVGEGNFSVNRTITIDYQAKNSSNQSEPRYIIFKSNELSFNLTSISITVLDGTEKYYTKDGGWVDKNNYSGDNCHLYTYDIYLGNDDGWKISDFKMETYCPDQYTNYSSDALKFQGIIKKYDYESELCNKVQSYGVLFPPDYDPNDKDTKYPVMYALHGWECTYENLYSDVGGVLYSMMQAGKCEKMIIVFPTMFSSADGNYSWPSGGITPENEKAYDRFLEVLTTELMPLVESKFNVKTGKDNTAVYGWSMGGREAMAIGFNYSDKFGYICACEPAPGLLSGSDWKGENHPGQLYNSGSLSFPYGREPYLFMICAGTIDNVVGTTTPNNDGIVGAPTTYHNIMNVNAANGANAEHIYYEVNSVHGAPATTSAAYNFGRYVFKNSNHDKGIRFEDLEAGTYIISEVVTPDGYASVSDITVTVSTSGKISVAGANTTATPGYNGYAAATQYTMEVENVSNTTDISIQKYDKDTDKTLNGAEFILYTYVDGRKTYYTGYTGAENSTKVATWDSDRTVAKIIKPTAENDNAYSVIGLSNDETYYLVETKAPDGYNLLPTPIELKINSDGKLVVNDNVLDADGTILASVATVFRYSENSTDQANVITINVLNSPGYELPETGGIGTHYYTFGGLLLIVIPLVYGFVRRRRERGAGD